MTRHGVLIFDEQVQQVVEQSWEFVVISICLFFVVDYGRSARKSTSTDVDDRRMSVDGKVAVSVVADWSLVAMADNNDNCEDRPTVCDELKEISPSGMDVDNKPFDGEFTGLMSLPSKVRKKRKKKKASKLKGTGSPLNNIKGEEVKKEEHISSEGILSTI